MSLFLFSHHLSLFPNITPQSSALYCHGDHIATRVSGKALPRLQPVVLRHHSILYSTLYVEVLAHKTLLLSYEPTAVPELYMNSRALILTPKLLLFAQNYQAWPCALYLI